MKRIKAPEFTCSDCIHRYACATWNIGSISNMDSGNCINFEKDDKWWHSVKAGNPTKIENEYREPILYLVCVDGTDQPFRAFFDGKNWGDGVSVLDVKWWMPLPTPPKEVNP